VDGSDVLARELVGVVAVEDGVHDSYHAQVVIYQLGGFVLGGRGAHRRVEGLVEVDCALGVAQGLGQLASAGTLGGAAFGAGRSLVFKLAFLLLADDVAPDEIVRQHILGLVVILIFDGLFDARNHAIRGSFD